MNIANNDIYRQFRLQDPQEFSLPSDIELLSNAVQQYGHQFNSVYENAPNTKSDSNKLETALSLQTVFNIEPESAMKFAEIGLQAGTVEGKTHEAGYGEALVQTGKNTYHNFLGGMGYSLYMMTKNEKFKEFADNQNKNVVDLWEDYNWLGDTVLSSIQPLGSQARFMGTTALVQGIPTLVASAFGPAAAKITSLVSGLVAAGINFGMTGLSQQGSEFYQLSKLADQQGHKLDMESPDAMFHFYFGAIAKGGIETVGMELFPGMSFLRKAISPSGIQKVTFETGKKMLAEGFMRTGLGVLVEGGEEFQDSYHSSWQENALKEIANRQGADFDLTSSREMVEQAWKEGLEGAKGMIIPSMLTGLVGGGAYGMRMRTEAKKGFSTPEGSVTVDLRAVKTTDVEFEETESTGKMEPFRASVVGDALIPVTEKDNRKAAKAKSTGMTAGQAIISDEVFGPDESFVNQAALATGAKLSGDTLVFNTQEELDRARFMLESVAFATESEGNTSSVTLRDSEGNLTRVSLSLIEEGQQVSEPDLTYVEDPEAPYALSRMTQDKAFEWQERQMIKESVGDVVSHTKGRISNTDLEASVDAIKLVAETLNIPTDQMLKDNLVFKLESASPKSERGYIENISVDGKKQYTIHISDKADATTILHEMGHFLRGTATREQLSEFSRYYGGESDAVWIEDVSEKGDKFVVNGKEYDSFDNVMKLVVQNEERFADDFVSYLRTGQAPTEGLQNLFSRMRAVLSRFIDEFGYRLSPEVRQAFDNLIAGTNGLPYSGSIPTDAEGNILYQPAPPTDSEAFKAWFGDSKVVDENGNPQIMYHGGSFDVTTDPIFSSSDGLYYFAKDYGVAQSYNRYGRSFPLTEVYLSIQNPFDPTNTKHVNAQWVKDWIEFLRDEDGWVDRFTGEEMETYDVLQMIEDSRLYDYDSVGTGERWHDFLKTAKNHHDGFYGYDPTDSSVIAVAFSPTQIKSATDNSGAFDAGNPNILFQEAPPINSEPFNKWFGDSKVVDENGNPLVVYHGSRQWFDAFNDGTEKKHSKAPKGSIFATSSRKVAGSYYDYWGGTDPDVILEKDSPLHQNYSWGTYRKGGVYSLYMKIENPLIIDFEGKLWDEGDYDINEITKRAKSEGYDGVIAKNIRDIGFNDIPRDEYGNYQDTIATDYIAFNSTQVKATNNQGTWDAGNPNILFQEAIEKINNGSLAVLHNISADKLVSADEIGGLPSPSLAITRPDIPFVQFGEITLIADPSVATKAMEEGRLYDRDVWSPTVPRAEWKINQKVIDNFDKKIMPVIYKETGKYFSGSDAFSRSDIIRGPNLLVDAYKRTIEAQIAFLKDRGIDYELKFKKPKPPLTFPMEVIEGNLEYFRSTKFETENSDTVREYLRPKINEYLEKSLAHRKEKNPALYETMKSDLLESYLRFGVLDRVFNFAKTYDKDALIFDEYGTQDGIRQTIKDHDSDFTSWIKDNINEAYTDPKIKIGTKKYEYNAENILEWMRSQSERASQDTMTYGPGKAASNAGRPFADREQVRDFEGTLVTREAQGVIWEETIKPLTESIQNELPDYNNRYSTWESLDAIYEAIGNYITKYGSTGTVQLMRKELSAKSFTKVPTWLLEQAVLLARRLATLQQDYFEAKPDRVVSLDEFNSAIVPNTISEEQRAVLKKHNISLYEYDTSENRQAIVEDLFASKSSQLLFQLSPEAKKEFLKLRKDEVQNAVENFFWVPDEIVREYAGETWADEEIATREYLRTFPWMLEEARQFPTSEEFLDYIKEQANTADGKEYSMTPTDEQWHRKVFAYSRIQSPEDRDKLFVKAHSSRQELLGLAKSLSAYQDVGSKKAYSGRKSNQTVIYRWGAFKGVSNYVKWLTPQSTDEEFERARKLIQENPRPYRKAMQVVEQAQARVHELKGWESQNYEASRDAYYDALGEELQEALAEPLSLNEMTDREAAEYLRTTDDKKARFDARERLATHNGVYMMELQANAELKALAADRDKIIETEKLRADTASKNLTELRVKHNDAMKELRSTEKAYNEAKKEVEKLSGKLDKASEKARRVAQLERDLADRRARVKELRTSLTEANRDLRRSRRVISQYEIRESNRITREKIEQLQKQVIRSIRMSDAMDRAYAPLFAYVQNKLGLTVPYSKPDMAWKKDLSVLYEYLPEEVMNLLEMDEQIDNWTVEAMQALIEGMDLLGKQARREHVIRMDMQRERRDKKGLDYYRELYGTYQPQTDQSVESIMAELRNSIDTTNQRYINGKESAFSRMFHGFTQSFAHMWSLARWLDNWKEGVAYDTLVKEVWDKYQDEYKEIQRRTGAFEKEQQELGMSANYLAERIVEVETTTGDTEQLTREQAITAYIYSLNEYSAKNLMEAGGNKLGIAGMTKIVQALDDKDIRFANAMLAAASNDAEYERVSEAFYRVYNHDLSQEENYFRMRAQGIEVDSVQNLATGPSRRPQSYVEKGFGVDRTGAVYPLNLNGVGTLLQTIREQEHLIAFGEWVRDMNYLLGPRGSMGHEISVRFGKTTLNTVQDYVNKIAGQQEIIADFEKLMNNLITQVSTSFISANLSSMLKQFASMSFALRGDISPKNFMKVMLGWSPASGIRDWKHAFDVMGDLDPSMRERTFDIETKRSRNLEYSNKFTRGMAKFRDIGIKYTTELGDSFVTTKLWWGAYLTGLEKYRDLEEEGRMRKAIFEASRFIAETQSSSNLMDLSPTQRSRHVWNRLLSQFKRDAFKRWNEIFWHIPYAARNKQWKEVGGIVVSNLMSMMVLAAVTGIFLKSEDDDKKKRANIILRAFLAQFMGEFVPYIGEGIQGGINGFSNNGLIDFNMDFGSFIGEAVDGDGFEKMWDRSWDLIVDGLALISVPSITAERIYKTIDERNFWRLLGGYWYKMKD